MCNCLRHPHVACADRRSLWDGLLRSPRLVAPRAIRMAAAALFTGVVLFGLAPVSHAFILPANDGFVTQIATVMTAEQERQLEDTLTAYERSSSNEIAVLIVETLQGEPIEDISNQVFRAWGVGKESKNNGVLIVLAAADHEVKIETGYGLEGAVPDIVARGVIDAEMIPQFREGKYFEGLVAGIDALQKHIGGEYTADRYTQGNATGFFPFLLFFLFLAMDFVGAWLARSKSFWLGGVLGGVLGVVLAALYSWWISIPLLVILGLLFDYVLSRHAGTAGRRGGRFGGGFGSGGGFGGGGGGFGGFGGGSSGGGGAVGRW